MKRILIFAHYYAPDVASTGQILQDLAEGMETDFDITVVCTVPSYTGNIEERYREKKLYREIINGVKVVRVPVPEFTKSSKLSRIKNLYAYFRNTRKAIGTVGAQDYVLTISQPPIMGGMLGVYGKKKLRTADGKHPKLVYCIQDFNPEQIEAVGYFKNRAVFELLRRLDNRSCQKSDLVITVGRDLVQTLENRFRGRPVPRHVMINNWIDEKEIYPLAAFDSGVTAFRERYGLAGKFVVMYSGNIGLYYDLENLIKVAERFRGAKTPDGREVAFAFVGTGTMLDRLVAYKAKKHLDNVVFIPYQDKDKLVYSLNAADVHWCVSAKGIRGVSCPSKFYGICGVQKAVLGVLEAGSEVQMLIKEIGCGLVCEPGAYAETEKNIAWFVAHAGTDELAEMGRCGHDYLIRNLTKDVSIARYMEALKTCGENRHA